METIDVAVIGDGVTGLAAARAVQMRGLSTCVIERHARPGLDTSTHNSGVIHAGIYDPSETLKAQGDANGVEGLEIVDSAFVRPRRVARVGSFE